MANPPEERPPVAVAMEWVSRITTIGLEMVLPGLGGYWLDQRLGTRFLVVIGFVFGFVAGMWHLLVIAQVVPGPKRRKGDRVPPD